MSIHPAVELEYRVFEDDDCLTSCDHPLNRRSGQDLVAVHFGIVLVVIWYIRNVEMKGETIEKK